jgi:hypothetical protein
VCVSCMFASPRAAPLCPGWEDRGAGKGTLTVLVYQRRTRALRCGGVPWPFLRRLCEPGVGSKGGPASAGDLSAVMTQVPHRPGAVDAGGATSAVRSSSYTMPRCHAALIHQPHAMRYRDKSGQLCVVLGGGAETHPRPKRRWCVREGCGCVHIDMSAAAGTPTVRWTCGAARRRSSRRWLDLCVCLAVLVKHVFVVCCVASRVGLRLRSRAVLVLAHKGPGGANLAHEGSVPTENLVVDGSCAA